MRGKSTIRAVCAALGALLAVFAAGAAQGDLSGYTIQKLVFEGDADQEEVVTIENNAITLSISTSCRAVQDLAVDHLDDSIRPNWAP